MLIVAGGLLLGFVAALSGFGGHSDAPGAVVTTVCAEDSMGVATVTLGSGTTTLTVDSTDALYFQQIPPPPGTPVPLTRCGSEVALSSIKFSVGTGVSGNTLAFDETLNSFPCAAKLSGNVGTGSGAAIDVLAPPAGDVTVGATTLDLDGCGTTQTNPKLNGVASYQLVANGADTLSAAGEATPADPVTVPVTFVAGQAGGGTETFNASGATGASTTLDFHAAYTSTTTPVTCPSSPPSCSLDVNSSGGDLTSPDLADFTATISSPSSSVLSTYDYSADGSAVTNFVGLNDGPTTFSGQVGSYTLTGLQPGSHVNAGEGTETYTVTGSGTTFTSGTDTDTFQVTGNDNIFQAGQGNDTFDDTLPATLTSPVKNTLDFSAVPSSNAGELAINDSGGPQTVTVGNASSPLMTGAAEVVPPPAQASIYNFANSPSGAGASSSSNFTNIIGATTGFTQFLAGGTGGLTLGGQGSSNSALFYGNNGVVANLTGGPETTGPGTLIGPSMTLANFTVPSEQVLVGAATSGSSCTLLTADCDTIDTTAGTIQSITGPTGGYSTFYSGASPGAFSFADVGGNNTFIGGSGSDTYSASGNSNDFVLGTGTGTVTDPGSGNTLDFSKSTTSSALTVNVSGEQVGKTPNDSAAIGVSAPAFTFGPSAATFVGGPGGTTFDAGVVGDTFMGAASASNTLSFANASVPSTATLSVCLVVGTGCSTAEQAVLQGTDEPFVNISSFVGLLAGNTTFVAGTPNGSSFAATGSGNKADFSGASAGVTVDMPAGTVGTDSISGLTDVIGSTKGGNTFTAAPISGSGSETFEDAGTKGGDSINFGFVSNANGVTPLYVNASGGTALSQLSGQVANDKAVVGSATYDFTNGGSNFVNFTGSSNGFTTFFAGGTGGYSFMASSGNDAIDFSAAPNPVTVDLSAGTAGTVSGFPGSLTDSITGLTTVTGSANGGNSFIAGPQPASYSFLSTGSNNDGNTVTVNTGNVTFSDLSGSGNTFNFGQVKNTHVTVNVSGSQDGPTANNTATGPTGTPLYTFDSSVTTFVGGPGGTTFDAGVVGDTFMGAASASNTLSFAKVSVPSTATLSVCLVVGTGCSTAEQAVLQGTDEPFVNISSFVGLLAGNTTFVAGTPNGSSFAATGSGNKADFSGASAGVTVDMPAGTVGTDSISGLTDVIGSTKGGNTFTAAPISGSGSETFEDAGTKGGDSINFGFVSNANGVTPLYVNASGGTALSQLSGQVANDKAVVGSATYDFTNGGSNFVNFTGSSNGFTTFFAGGTGGYSFMASSGNDAIDFSAAPNPVTVDLSAGTAGTVSGFPGSLTDSITGLTTVTGSANGGNSFIAGPQPASYSFLSTGSNNDGNTVTVNTGNVTFSDLSGSGNTFNFGQVKNTHVTVNVSGSQDGPTANNTATGPTGTPLYTFDSSVTTFVGGPGGTTFDAGVVGDTFMGAASASNTLSFAKVSVPSTATLSVCLVVGTGCSTAEQAVLQGTDEPFVNISSFVGLLAGNTTFVAGTPNGSSFAATGSGNKADFSGASAGVTVDMPAGTVGTDSISGLTDVIGSTKGGNTFTADASSDSFTSGGNNNTFTGGAGTDTFTATGNDNTFNVGTGSDTMSDSGTGNAISFQAVQTGSGTGLDVNVSGTPVNGDVGNDTAVLGSGLATYNFVSGAAGFTSFTGAGSGDTTFTAAPSTGGYSFTGTGLANTADFSANRCGVTANILTGAVNLTSGTNCGSNTATDTIGGITTVIGAQAGTNVFDGDLQGNIFTSTAAANTLSYGGFTASGLCFNLTGTAAIPTLPASTGDRVGLGASCITPAADYVNVPAGSLTVEGSPNNDVFQIGTPAVAIEGGGGDDGLDLSSIAASGMTGATVDLGNGLITSPTINGVTFTPGCGAAADLCVSSIKGSNFNDTYIVNSAILGGSLPALAITGNGGGNDTLDLSPIAGRATATIEMPIAGTTGTPSSPAVTCSGHPPGPTGYVCTPGGPPALSFTGISTIKGTATGGDYFYVGTGTEDLAESASGAAGTLDFSALPASSSPPNGVTVDVSNATGPSGGGATSPGINVTDTFTQIGTFIGTPSNDTFIQSGTGDYNFFGEKGSNTLNLSGAPAQTQVTLTAPDSTCSAGLNNDGTAIAVGLIDDSFTCMASVISSSSNYEVAPGDNATVNGNGTGTLKLDDTAINAKGVTVTMPQTPSGLGTVTGDGFDFSFTGMQIVDGTPFNDLFIPGDTPVTINGGGGDDGVSFAGAPAAVVVNLSGSPYAVPTVPLGLTDAGATVPADTAVGGVGGLSTPITLDGISNVMSTAKGSDIVVAGPGSGTLVGGTGNDTFVPTGGNDVIDGGTGSDTLDLSLLPSYSTFNLGSSAPQNLGVGDGSLAVVPGTIEKIIASPTGSTLQAGPGNITLVGGQGNDLLEAGNGTQTLMAGTGDDTLEAGIGTDKLVGGPAPVTFVPGQGNDTLTTQLTSPGNTLSYRGSPGGAQINLSGQLYVSTQLPANTAVGGWGGTVSLAGAQISQVIGSPEADTFITGSAPVNINGGGGNDQFVVNSGGNTLTAGTGTASSFLIDASGGNIINGGGSSTVDFSLAPAGVNVNLATGVATGGFGGTQSLTGIQNIVGTNSADVLIAGAKGQTLTGGNGGDLLEASAAGGDTLISGGNGNDTFCDQVGCHGMAAAAGGNTLTGGSGDDDFFAQNPGVDTITGHADDVAFVDPQDIVIGIPPQDINP